MKEVTIKLYKFDELSEPAKEKARQWWRDCENEDFGRHGELWEPAVTAAKILGIQFADRQVPLMSGKTRTEPDIRYSGFSSQGDGASFVGTYEYAKGCARAIRKEFPQDTKLHSIADELTSLQRGNGYKLTARITQNDNHYVHKYTMRADVYKGDEDASEDVSEAILSTMRDFAEWIYRGLESEYEYRMSDEAVDESILANEYDFRKDGERSDG